MRSKTIDVYIVKKRAAAGKKIPDCGPSVNLVFITLFKSSAQISRIFNLQILPHPLPLIQSHLISYHRNELRVGRFPAQVMDGIAEVAVKGIHVSPIPCHLDGMADGAFHPAGGSAVFLGDFRVQALGHGVDVLRLVHGEQDGIPQELVALDVGGHAIREGQ